MIEDASPATRADTGTLLTAQLTGLEELVLQANKPGNLDGLLAHHILGARRLSVPWNVDPMSEQWMADNEHRLAHAHGLAVLGYGLTSFPSPAAQAARRHLAAGLPPLMRKNPFQTDGVTFVNDPAQIVGLALAVTAAHEDVPPARAWLADVLHDPRLQPANLLLGVFQEHARQVLDTAPVLKPDILSSDDPVDLAGLHWLASSAKSLSVKDPNDLRRLQSKILTTIALGQTGQVSAPRAALLMEAAAQIVTASVDELVLSRNHVGVLLSRFEDAMRQWRYDGDDLDNPVRWPITSEREVQNIIWIMLRPVFDDLVDEETLRKRGHSTYRADFGIPSLGLLIEVKYARKAADFKTFEKEIYEDYVAYLTGNGPYRKMTVFIYDESVSVQEHGTTRRALLDLPNITDVIIVCRPSHVPAPARTPRRRTRRTNP
ncbi:hypothetical protein [Catellatospora bangladeshensis]|uniref:Uncharacterized protein n=1 Tax=Catellatospora bangladeshensis TaxID=310355 RepID=A0A8J3JMK8_9ACTN|nr:hypothetical protein [Catellatospora bangladeshensis]GIF83348.1 hypothetical protein Cba03nite_46970 [Catellatospora bangladeshensis]